MKKVFGNKSCIGR